MNQLHHGKKKHVGVVCCEKKGIYIYIYVVHPECSRDLLLQKKDLMYFFCCVIGVYTPEKNINWMILHLPPKFTRIGIITIIPYQKNPNTHPKSKISKIDAFKKSVPFKWLRNLIDKTLKLPGVQLLPQRLWR